MSLVNRKMLEQIFAASAEAVMVVRLVLGLTVMSSHYWFANHLPTVFHLVLASFMGITGAFHLRYAASRPVVEG